MIGGCVNWVLMVNMTMYTCLPKRRSTANAVQMFTGHILGKSVRFTFNFRIFREQVDKSWKIWPISGKLIHLWQSIWMSFPKSGRPSKKSDFSRTNFLMNFFRWCIFAASYWYNCRKTSIRSSRKLLCRIYLATIRNAFMSTFISIRNGSKIDPDPIFYWSK